MLSESQCGPPWTISKILSWTSDFFRSRIPDNTRMDAELLLAHTLGCQRLDLYLHWDKPLNDEELTRYRELIRRRAGYEPIAYLLGYKEFWSLKFDVTPDVLIPRPDTERLIEVILNSMDEEKAIKVSRILELGTGSGAVSIVLAKERQDCLIVATDIAPEALSIAEHNARIHGVHNRISFYAGHWVAPIDDSEPVFDYIVSNPPYIPTAELSSLSRDIALHEPVKALDGGRDGVKCLSQILESAHSLLRPGGNLILEMGCDQKERVEDIAHSIGVYNSITFYKDYAGHNRIVLLRK